MYIATMRARLEAREAGFLVSNKLEQLLFKSEKNIGIEKNAGKVRKLCCPIRKLPFFRILQMKQSNYSKIAQAKNYVVQFCLGN